jgi:hypothetical protein
MEETQTNTKEAREIVDDVIKEAETNLTLLDTVLDLLESTITRLYILKTLAKE